MPAWRAPAACCAGCEQTLEWNDAGVEGASRVLRRLWALSIKRREDIVASAEPSDAAAARTLRRDMHLLLRQVSYDYERMQYNTVVSGTMKMLNALEAAPAGGGRALREGMGLLLRALYPACPHLTWVLWRELGFVSEFGDLLDAPWPQVDEAALVQDEIELVLQVNGKTRGNVRVDAKAESAAIEAAAVASPDFVKFAAGRAPKKVIVVPGRLVNVVV
jgi:leucyl-tRNA synthetase